MAFCHLKKLANLSPIYNLTTVIINHANPLILILFSLSTIVIDSYSPFQ